MLSRDIPTNQLRPERDFCSFEKVLAFPDQITCEADRLHLSQVIQRDTGHEFQSLGYAVKEDRDPVDLGIAKIMSHMADLELRAVHRLSEQQLLQNSMLLVKDGPLRYKNLGGRGFDITQFRNVIGLSKSFRPSFTVGTGRGKKDVGALTAGLEIGTRTPVYKTFEDDRIIGIWYVRLRPRQHMANPLDGIVKVECYAIDGREMETGLDSDRINTLSAHLLNERNVTPYGRDARWATHIYPIYSAETFIKASFLSDIHFEAVF